MRPPTSRKRIVLEIDVSTYAANKKEAARSERQMRDKLAVILRRHLQAGDSSRCVRARLEEVPTDGAL